MGILSILFRVTNLRSSYFLAIVDQVLNKKSIFLDSILPFFHTLLILMRITFLFLFAVSYFRINLPLKLELLSDKMRRTYVFFKQMPEDHAKADQRISQIKQYTDKIIQMHQQQITPKKEVVFSHTKRQIYDYNMKDHASIKYKKYASINIDNLSNSNHPSRQLHDNKKLLSNNKYLRKAFYHFCKQSYNQKGMFGDYNKEANIMNLNKWMVFCKQFSLHDKFSKEELALIYKKANNHRSEMNYQNFILAMSILQSKYQRKYRFVQNFIEEVLQINSQMALRIKMQNLKISYAGPKRNFFQLLMEKECLRKQSKEKERQYESSRKRYQVSLTKQPLAIEKLKKLKHHERYLQNEQRKQSQDIDNKTYLQDLIEEKVNLSHIDRVRPSHKRDYACSTIENRNNINITKFSTSKSTNNNNSYEVINNNSYLSIYPNQSLKKSTFKPIVQTDNHNSKEEEIKNPEKEMISMKSQYDQSDIFLNDYGKYRFRNVQDEKLHKMIYHLNTEPVKEKLPTYFSRISQTRKPFKIQKL